MAAANSAASLRRRVAGQNPLALEVFRILSAPSRGRRRLTRYAADGCILTPERGSHFLPAKFARFVRRGARTYLQVKHLPYARPDKTPPSFAYGDADLSAERKATLNGHRLWAIPPTKFSKNTSAIITEDVSRTRIRRPIARCAAIVRYSLAQVVAQFLQEFLGPREETRAQRSRDIKELQRANG
jgi:hypothetical protein